MTIPKLPDAPGRSRIFLWSLSSLFLLMVWDYSGLDLAMAHWFGAATGFALNSHWLWRDALHDDIHYLPWILELALLLAIWKPFGTLKLLPTARRTQFALTTLVALLVVSYIKIHSRTSCPWDLKQFGGVATYVSHWAWGIEDGGSGRCFPAGHASAGFAFVGGYFAFRHHLPQTARRWLVGAMLVGFVFGFSQQVRGAHYMSHTLWTAWFCWTAAATVDFGVSQWILQKRLRAHARVPDLSVLTPLKPSE